MLRSRGTTVLAKGFRKGSGIRILNVIPQKREKQKGSLKIQKNGKNSHKTGQKHPSLPYSIYMPFRDFTDLKPKTHKHTHTHKERKLVWIGLKIKNENAEASCHREKKKEKAFYLSSATFEQSRQLLEIVRQETSYCFRTMQL